MTAMTATPTIHSREPALDLIRALSIVSVVVFHGVQMSPEALGQTLTDDAEVFYQMSTPYRPGYDGGVNYADSKLAIPWPLPVAAISDRDRALPPFP